MPEWPSNGETDWNTKMLANLAVAHDTDGNNKYPVGGAPTTVFTKYLTGILDSDSSTSIAHGVSGIDKIMAVVVLAFDTTSSNYSVSETFAASVASSTYRVRFDATNIFITGVGSGLQGQKYRIKIDYIL